MCAKKATPHFPEALMLPACWRPQSRLSGCLSPAAAKAELLQEPLRGERAAAAIQSRVENEQTGISAHVDVDISPYWIILLTPEFSCCFLRLWISIFWAVLGDGDGDGDGESVE